MQTSVDDPEMIQQLIQARIGHAEAEGLALELHRQNGELRQVIRKFKQKLTSMEVRLYKMEEEEEVLTNAQSKDDHSSTFGARNFQCSQSVSSYPNLSAFLCLYLLFHACVVKQRFVTSMKHVAGVRNALRKTLFGSNSSGASANSGGAGGEN
jgi:hypothetical protein